MKKKYLYLVCSIIIIGCFISMAYSSKAEEYRSQKPIKFKIQSIATDTQDVEIDHEAVFDVEYFREKSTVYNNELAKMSLQLALAASNTSQSFEKYGEVLKVAHVEDEIIDFSTSRNGYLVNAYKDMGFSKDVYYKYETPLNDTSDSAAHGIATKKIYVNGKEYNLVNVVVRSSTYGGEWASNYRLVNDEGVSGFYTAGKKVYENLEKYLKDNKLGTDTKIWICGLSRGGAVANVAAAHIDRACEEGTINVDRDNVYAYTIAAPNAVIDGDEKEISKPVYDNIMNVIYEIDVFSMVGPQEYGFRKYGKIHMIPTIHISAKDMERIKKGKKPKDKSLTEEEIAKAKDITTEYYKIRYSNYPSEYENIKDNLYKGFAIEKGFSVYTDVVFTTFAKDVNVYEENWQDVFTDIIPFLLARVKKYDEDSNTWVRYKNIKEYLEYKHGKEIYSKAISQGVYSEEEYNKELAKIDNLYHKKIINEEKKEMLKLMIDTYYGIRIVAINYGLDKADLIRSTEGIKTNFNRIIEGGIPISNVLSSASNHRGELYLAMLRYNK